MEHTEITDAEWEAQVTAEMIERDSKIDDGGELALIVQELARHPRWRSLAPSAAVAQAFEGRA